MDSYIYDCVRTVRGKGSVKGSLHSLTSVYLASYLFKHLQKKHNLDAKLIDDLIIGCVTPINEQGGNVAKAISFESGYGDQLPGITINRFCSSGLDAICQASSMIKAGYNELIIAGGVESMSRVKIGSDGGLMFEDKQFIHDHSLLPQGLAADLIATFYDYSREQLDEYAAESQRRAYQAEISNYFSSRISVTDINNILLLDRDESIRPHITFDKLAEIKPAFSNYENYDLFIKVIREKFPQIGSVKHLHHAGNSCAVVDAAALSIVGNKSVGAALSIKPIAKIKAIAISNSDPTLMLTGPGYAALKALKMAKMNKSDIDLYEINEAFAAVVLRSMEIIDIDHAIVNVNGGAIAMGHPLGATGCILTGVLLDELIRRDKQCGLVTLCMGGGMGMAAIFERV